MVIDNLPDNSEENYVSLLGSFSMEYHGKGVKNDIFLGMKL